MWEQCKYLFDGMEKALNNAKEKRPNEDYSEAEKKLSIMEDLQLYLGRVYDDLLVVKRLNLENGEIIFKQKQKILDLSKENKKLTEENNQLKININ